MIPEQSTTVRSMAPETICLEEAAQLLRTSPSHLRKMTAAGKIPGAKFGRRWVYVRADLIELIREQAKARTPRAISVRQLRGAGPGSRSALVDDLRAQRMRAEQSGPGRRPGKRRAGTQA